MATQILQVVKPKSYRTRYPRKLAGKPLLYIASGLASLGDALLGYSQGITAGFQVQPTFIYRIYGETVTHSQISTGTTHVDPRLPAIIICSLCSAAVVSSLLSPYASDFLGRRQAMQIGAVLYLISSCVQMIAPDFRTLVAGRAIQGLAAGMISTTSAVYQVEISPAGSRGMLTGLEALCMNAGYAAASWVAYAFFVDSKADHAWRGPFAVQAVVSLVLLVGSFFLPESPRWLLQKGFLTEGLWTLADLHAGGDVTDEGVNRTYHAIVATLKLDDAARGSRLGAWRDFKNYPRRTRITITSRMFAQSNGINAILHFLPEHLAHAGYPIRRSLFYAGVCSLFYSLGPLPAILFVDKVGRRRFLIVGSMALACSLVILGCLQLYIRRWPALHDLSGARGVVFGVSLYLFFFGATWGPVPWLISAELFPLRMRTKGMAIATASDWVFEGVVGIATPPLLIKFGGIYYFVLAGACVFSGFVVWWIYVETCGSPLEVIGGMFGDALPSENQIDQEDPVLHVQRTRLRLRSVLSMPEIATRSTAVASHAGTSQITLAAVPEDGIGGKDAEKNV
ncbi:unnamed protein product [Mycena citricolor]|uniref:Major facilitator superfamily (MFS) profile domain-containing protein n=1 Tax=Mycena citricolor TaxID=2018698 RepID=A0AAD2HCE1_9AGAR|nr:unnamed protein product [Mycena citricolor]